MFTIKEAVSETDIKSIRILFEEYGASLNFDLCFQSFDEELKNLPGEYAPPSGTLLIAAVNNIPIGCVALRKLDNEICEMKRLFVKNNYRGMNIGRALIEKLIEKAKSLGYKKMRLDTVPSMQKAQKLYCLTGFYVIDAYRENPIEGAMCMELVL